MRKSLIVAALIAGSASVASAQLAGGVVHGAAGAVSDTTSGVVGEASGATVDTPSIVGGATRTVTARKTVQVQAGTRMQVARETRCYDGANYWDPYYGADGYYYCQSTGPGAAIGASVAAKH
jgi:hypothetical protein